MQTIRTITASEQNQTLALLKVKGQKVTPKQLLLLKDSDTDKKLATAEQSSTYDDVLLATINQLVLEYEKTAKSATSSPVGNTEKALTATLATNAKVLANIK